MRTPQAATSTAVVHSTRSMCRHGAAGSFRGDAPAPSDISRPPPSAIWSRSWMSVAVQRDEKRGGPSILAPAERDRTERLAGQAVEDAAGHRGSHLATEPRLLHEHRH